MFMNIDGGSGNLAIIATRLSGFADVLCDNIWKCPNAMGHNGEQSQIMQSIRRVSQDFQAFWQALYKPKAH